MGTQDSNDRSSAGADQVPPAPVAPRLGNAPPLAPPTPWSRLSTSLLSRNGLHVLLVIGLLIFLVGVKWYVSDYAGNKAAHWLTSYNGTETTKVVGPITA